MPTAIRPRWIRGGRTLNKGVMMSLEEAVPGNRPIDPKQLGDLMDGHGEYAGALAQSESHVRRLVDQLRFQHEVLAEIHDLTDPASKTPLADRDGSLDAADVAVGQRGL